MLGKRIATSILEKNVLPVSALGKRDLSITSTAMANQSFKLVVIGGGAGGCTAAARFSSKLGAGNVAVIEPKETHYYQPIWTLVGGGLKSLEESAKPMASVLPKKATWIKDSVATFDPDNNKVTTASGDEISYEFLVVAMGLQLRYENVKGLVDALQTPGSGVCSNYAYEHVGKTWKAIQDFRSGNAVFTFPNTPVKCAGAPQKIMYITEDQLRKMNKRESAKVIYHTALPVLFGVKKYADALWKVVEERGIEVNNRSNLVEVKSDTREAVFENLDDPSKRETVPYEMLHVSPPMGSPDVLKKATKLVDEAGFLTVDKETLQHTKYKNIFGTGDCTNIPVAKTAAAVAAQSPVLKSNLQAVMNGQSLKSKYDGYTSCPLVTGKGELILAEFDMQAPPQPLETFPWNQAKPLRLSYFLKANVMPQLYWKMMLRGYWGGPRYMRKALHLGMSR